MVIITKVDTYNPLTKCPRCGFELYLAQDVSYDVNCPHCGTLIREKTDPNKTKIEDAGEKGLSIFSISILFGFVGSFLIVTVFGALFDPNVKYIKDGLCDVCKAPASYIAYAGYNVSNFKPVNEFCFFHALQWGISQITHLVKLPPFEILEYTIIIFLVVWVICSILVYKIYKQ